MPSTLNKLLIALGRLIGQITILALATALFIAPVTAILMASFYISFTLAHGAGEFLGFVIFCVLVGLSGRARQRHQAIARVVPGFCCVLFASGQGWSGARFRYKVLKRMADPA
jgi:hypothetical protein